MNKRSKYYDDGQFFWVKLKAEFPGEVHSSQVFPKPVPGFGIARPKF